MANRKTPSSGEWTKFAASLAYVIWFIATYWPGRRKEAAVLRGLHTDALEESRRSTVTLHGVDSLGMRRRRGRSRRRRMVQRQLFGEM